MCNESIKLIDIISDIEDGISYNENTGQDPDSVAWPAGVTLTTNEAKFLLEYLKQTGA